MSAQPKTLKALDFQEELERLDLSKDGDIENDFKIVLNDNFILWLRKWREDQNTFRKSFDSEFIDKDEYYRLWNKWEGRINGLLEATGLTREEVFK